MHRLSRIYTALYIISRFTAEIFSIKYNYLMIIIHLKNLILHVAIKETMYWFFVYVQYCLQLTVILLAVLSLPFPTPFHPPAFTTVTCNKIRAVSWIQTEPVTIQWVGMSWARYSAQQWWLTCADLCCVSGAGSYSSHLVPDEAVAAAEREASPQVFDRLQDLAQTSRS